MEDFTGLDEFMALVNLDGACVDAASGPAAKGGGGRHRGKYHPPKTLGLSRRRAVRPVQRRVARAACGERRHGTGARLRWVHHCGCPGSRRLFPSPKVAASA